MSYLLAPIDLGGIAIRWWGWIAEATWQSTLLAIALLVVAAVASRWPSPLRHGILVVALIKFAVPPILATPAGFFPWLGNALPAIADSDPQVASEPSPSALIVGSVQETAVASAVDGEGQAAAAGVDWLVVLMLFHGAGAGLTLLWIHRQYRLLGQLAASATLIDPEELAGGEHGTDLADLARRIGLRKMPRLIASPRCTAPIAFGLRRPTVLLPQAMIDAEDPEALEVALAHELAHLRRGDLWINALQIALLAVWWWNPIYHLLSRTVRRLREDCCDDLLLAQRITDGRRYCAVLLRLADQLGSAGRSFPRPALGLAERLHPLGHRLRRLMDASLGRTPGLSWLALGVLVALTSVLLPGRALVGGGGANAGELEGKMPDPYPLAELARSEVRQLWPAFLLDRLTEPAEPDLSFDQLDFDAEGLRVVGRAGDARTIAVVIERIRASIFTEPDVHSIRKAGDRDYRFDLRVEKLEPELSSAPSASIDLISWRQWPDSQGLRMRALPELRRIMDRAGIRLERFVPSSMEDRGWPIQLQFESDDPGLSQVLRALASSPFPMIFDRLIVTRGDDGRLSAEAQLVVRVRAESTGAEASSKTFDEMETGDEHRVAVDPETLERQLEMLHHAVGNRASAGTS